MKSCNLKGQQKVFFLQNNQVASCCRAYPTSLADANSVFDLEQQWLSESRSLDQGIELKGCETCWTDERQGLESFRQQSNVVTQPNTLELFVDNTCNQMCSYCSPKFSSTWQQSIQQQGQFQRISAGARDNLEPITLLNDTQLWIDNIHKYINQCNDNSIDLVLLGGEPLMQLRNLQSLLIANPDKISTLKIITNLNPPNPKFLHWVLDAFPLDKLKFAISLDATPEYNHVPRGKFDLDRFNQNLKLLKQHNVDYGFLSVVSVLSLFDLDRFVNWIEDSNVRFIKINNPDCLHPKYLPVAIKQQILSRIQGLDVPKFIPEMLANTDSLVDLKLFEQYNYLTQYFQRVGIVPRTVNNTLFQEYWNWLENFITAKYENRNSVRSTP